jgi:hypothetical protein
MEHEIWFQKGEYPVRQVIYPGMDSIGGKLLTPTLLKPTYGRVDVVHQISIDHFDSNFGIENDAIEKLLCSTKPVITTCWDPKDLIKILPEYADRRGWDIDHIRVYQLIQRLF